MNYKVPLAALVLCTGLLVLPESLAQGRNPYYGPGRNYATDNFEGFDALDADTRIPQKGKSLFRASARQKSPVEQLAYAKSLEAANRAKRARKAYDALVRAWPTAPEASEAQMALAALLERMQKFEKAFDEYQYLLVHYAGNCPYQEILDRQYRIANYLLHNNTSIFGWRLSGSSAVRERFEQIVNNAPRAAKVPEIMLVIGGIRMSENELPEAVRVYEGLLNRFPGSPEAPRAGYLAAQCLYELAVKHSYNEPRCREAIAFIKSAMTRMPRHPQREQFAGWLAELTHLLVEQNYQQALFYDTRQRNTKAAEAAYRRFLTEFPDSQYAPQIRARLKELEGGAAPAR